MKKIIAYTFTTIAILIFIFSIAIMFIGSRAMRNNEPLYIFGYTFSIIPSDSMIGDQEDSLDRYDVAIIRAANYDEIEIGDVVVFQSEVSGVELLIIHRVIGLHEDGGFETQGDNNDFIDPNPVTEENFQGIYYSKITFLKPIASIAANSRNLIFGLLSVVLIVLLVTEGMHIIKTISREKKAELEEKHQQELASFKEKERQKIKDQIYEEEKAKNKTKNES
ncbi:MAG: signal peptidase I [Tenericutes bacterium]|nr:signal peptidase I [Mycoplasmatota bacterium]